MFSFLSSRTLPHINNQFWKNKRVFITGHTGFIGGWLSFWLHDLGAELAGYALAPNSDPNFYGLTNLSGKGQQHIADIRDAATLKKTIMDFDPHIVLHLAAQALVRPAFKTPADTFSTNITGTINLLDAVRACKNLMAALIFTTDKVYHNTEIQSGYREDAALGGYEPYGASKACAEIVTQSYWHSYFKNPLVPMATLRAGNVIGGGDWSVDRLIPDAVRAFTSGAELVLRRPESVRPWQHVLEPCYAIMRMVEHMADQKPPLYSLNIGPNANDSHTVGSIADRFVAAWNSELNARAAWKHVPDHAIYEATLLKLDNHLAKKMIGWQPRWNIDDTIRHTVAWYAAHRRGENMEMVTRQQISDFINGEQHGKRIESCA